MDEQRETDFENVDLLIDRAAALLEHGSPQEAIENLREVLARSPDHARAHALLALALAANKRLHAADHEAGLALQLEPESAYAHHARGVVYMAQRRLVDAEKHLDAAMSFEPEDPAIRRALADVYLLSGREAKVMPTLEAARDVAPDDIDTWVAIGDEHLRRGEVAAAEELARAALAESAEHRGALVLMGHVLIRRGQVQEAWEHARAALSENATDPQALHLLCQVKARTSWFLGLWWRWSTWMNVLGDSREIMVLLGLFLLYRVANQLANDLDRPGLASALNFVWLAFVAYTWVGPGMFRRMLRRELRDVRLNDGY